MKKIIIAGVVVVLAVIYAFMERGKDSNVNVAANLSVSVSPALSTSVSPTPSPTAIKTSSPTATHVSSVKTFTVAGKPFSFTPSQITVNKGDTVKIVFKNESGTHDWRIDEFNAHTKVIQGGAEETIQFVADKVGSFEYYCSVGAHRLMGMKGTLQVR